MSTARYDGPQGAFAIRTLAAWYERQWRRGAGPQEEDAEAVQWILALARGAADYVQQTDQPCITLHAQTDEERVIVDVIDKTLREERKSA